MTHGMGVSSHILKSVLVNLMHWYADVSGSLSRTAYCVVTELADVYSCRAEVRVWHSEVYVSATQSLSTTPIIIAENG